MNGAEGLIATAVKCGVEVCFANPGTTEMPLVMALDAVPGIRAVPCLFEGVASGAADGYSRMKGKPALTLLHLGPGLANAIANLHNARRARSPVVNIVGDHARWHLAADSPLTSDIATLASPVSGWVKCSMSARSLGADLAEALVFATTRSAQVATLIVPHDLQLESADLVAGPCEPLPPACVSERAVARARDLISGEKPAALFLGGDALLRRGLAAAERIRAATGCTLVCEGFVRRLDRGGGLPSVVRFPYFPEQGRKLLDRFRAVVFAGAREPVTFFGYPGIPSRVLPETIESATLAEPADNVEDALERLAESLSPARFPSEQPAAPPNAAGPLTPEALSATVAAVLPEGAIVMDEGNTSSGPFFRYSAGAPAHSYLNLTGGAIGIGLPCATGAALACPDRRVIALEADGSALYTLQALWTQAREGLNVTTVLCANRSYRILAIELERAGVKQRGPQADSLVDLSRPVIDWVSVARGLGVPAVRAATAEDLARELYRALRDAGPALIEAIVT